MRYFGLFDGSGRVLGLVRVTESLHSEQLDTDGIWRNYTAGPDAWESVQLSADEAATVALILGVPDAVLVAA